MRSDFKSKYTDSKWLLFSLENKIIEAGKEFLNSWD